MCSVFTTVGSTENFTFHHWQAVCKIERQTITFSPRLSTFSHWSSSICNVNKVTNAALFFLYVLQTGGIRPLTKKNTLRPHFRLQSAMGMVRNVWSAVTAFHHVFTGTKQTHIARCTCLHVGDWLIEARQYLNPSAGEFFKVQWSTVVLMIIKIWKTNTNHRNLP